jgi:myo-inositol-1(or 4)-monophosphatase
MTPAELERICIAAAEAGARVLLELYEKPREITMKGRTDLVTDADGASEQRILKLLRERAPAAAVLAEESGASGQGEVRFIVDPLDGTTNYAHGLPLFTCTVAAELNGQLAAGCTVDPCRGETFHASRGGGAWIGDARLSVSTAARLVDAVVCTGFPYKKGDKLGEMIGAFGLFTAESRGTQRLGSAALDLAYVAAGRLDLFYEQGLKPWDIAAGVLLVAEAGGVVTRFDGSPLTLDGGEIVASNPALAEASRAVLREARAKPWVR